MSSKLLQRLQDASRSGVYRASRADALVEVAREGRPDLARISLHGAHEKDVFLRSIAAALGFPAWFGGNWDALEDCLCDLSWRPAAGRLLVFEDFAAGEDLGILCDILASCAEFWATRGTPFFAVFVDPGRSLALPDLYREA